MCSFFWRHKLVRISHDVISCLKLSFYLDLLFNSATHTLQVEHDPESIQGSNFTCGTRGRERELSYLFGKEAVELKLQTDKKLATSFHTSKDHLQQSILVAEKFKLLIKEKRISMYLLENESQSNK